MPTQPLISANSVMRWCTYSAAGCSTEAVNIPWAADLISHSAVTEHLSFSETCTVHPTKSPLATKPFQKRKKHWNPRVPQKYLKSHWCIPLTATFSKRRKIGAFWSERCDVELNSRVCMLPFLIHDSVITVCVELHDTSQKPRDDEERRPPLVVPFWRFWGSQAWHFTKMMGAWITTSPWSQSGKYINTQT